jgi:hypothetical protein
MILQQPLVSFNWIEPHHLSLNALGNVHKAQAAALQDLYPIWAAILLENLNPGNFLSRLT